VVPYSVGRVIWYQGESNTGSGEWKHYTKLLAELIACWRIDFEDLSLPFTVVQIADWDVRNDDAWRGIQRAQEQIVDFVDDVTVIRSADLCEHDDIHPPTKIHLANRIFESLK
jgi:sialate O-acetylesterase